MGRSDLCLPTESYGGFLIDDYTLTYLMLAYANTVHLGVPPISDGVVVNGKQ